MGFIKMLIELPLLVVIAIFAFTNNEMVVFNLWPFYLEVTVSLSVTIVLLLFAGYLIGKLDSWLSYAPLRKALRTQVKQNKKLSKEHQKLAETVIGLKENLETAKTETLAAEQEAEANRPSLATRIKQKFSGLFKKKTAVKEDFWML